MMHKHFPGSMPPPPPPSGPWPGPTPPNYPYTHNHHDSCNCCSHMKPPVPPDCYPASGNMIENGFMLINTSPFLYDNTNVQYGQRLSVGENVNTRVSQRRDPSCINLSATFDMTDDIITNTVLNHYIEQFIETNSESLNGVLPIIRNYTTFTLYFTIHDSNGGIVYESSKSVNSSDMKIHATDVKDFYINSCKNIITTNIPMLDFQGMYTLTLNNITASVNVLNVIEHISDGLNPYYQFTNNNTKIAVQHETIMADTESDGELLIASCDINQSFMFQSNVTTRMKVSFTAFMSNLISVPNTFNIWEKLCNDQSSDVDELVADLQKEISILKSTVEKLSTGLGDKVDKEEGKGLSSNDYTDEDKELLHTLVNKGQIVFDQKDNFPTPGVTNILYVATDLHLTYLWDDESNSYISLNNFDVEKVKTIIEEAVNSAVDNNETITELDGRVEKLETQVMNWTYLGD